MLHGPSIVEWVPNDYAYSNFVGGFIYRHKVKQLYDGWAFGDDVIANLHTYMKLCRAPSCRVHY